MFHIIYFQRNILHIASTDTHIKWTIKQPATHTQQHTVTSTVQTCGETPPLHLYSLLICYVKYCEMLQVLNMEVGNILVTRDAPLTAQSVSVE